MYMFFISINIFSSHCLSLSPHPLFTYVIPTDSQNNHSKMQVFGKEYELMTQKVGNQAPNKQTEVKSNIKMFPS